MKPVEFRDSIPQRLSTQRALIGLMQTHPNPALAEMAGICGYDFLVLDCKHGLSSESDHLQTLQALTSTKVLALVRLAGHDAHAIGRYLDMVLIRDAMNAQVDEARSTLQERAIHEAALILPALSYIVE